MSALPNKVAIATRRIALGRLLSAFVQLLALLMLGWLFLRLDGVRMFETSNGCASRIAWAVGECAPGNEVAGE